DQKHDRSLAASDRRVYPSDVPGVGWSLWQPQRLAHRPRVPFVPHLQAARGLSVVLALRRPHAGPGPRRKYGSKVDYTHLPEQCLKETTVEGPIQTRLYQAQLLHKEFAQPLNVVIIVKTHLRTRAQAHVLLFSSDLTLTYASLVDYYGL